MCLGQSASSHCKVLPSCYQRLSKFRVEEIKQQDHWYLYVNEHYWAFQVGLQLSVPGTTPQMTVPLRQCHLDPNTQWLETLVFKPP